MVDRTRLTGWLCGLGMLGLGVGVWWRDGGVAEQRRDAQRAIYPADPRISRPDGVPLDSPGVYFRPKKALPDSAWWHDMREVEKKTHSLILHQAHEPILSNYYLGHPRVRTMWQRSSRPAIVLTLHRDSGRVWLETKAFDHHLSFVPFVRVRYVPPPGGAPSVHEPPPDSAALAREQAQLDSLNHYFSHSALAVDRVVPLTLADWEALQRILTTGGYWQTESDREPGCFDGNGWLVEAHLPDRYHAAYHHCLSDPATDVLNRAGWFLLRRSQLPDSLVR